MCRKAAITQGWPTQVRGLDARGTVVRITRTCVTFTNPRCNVLVLSRTKSEEILIAETIRIKVLEIVGNRVRIGIDCPRDVPVMRAEKAGERREFTLPLSRFMPLRKAS